jgi:hypothetical protein
VRLPPQRGVSPESRQKASAQLSLLGIRASYPQGMDRVAWTNERLDDLSRRMDAGFDRVDHDIRDLRGEMNSGFADVRSEIDGLRSLIFRMGGGIIASVIASALLHGL